MQVGLCFSIAVIIIITGALVLGCSEDLNNDYRHVPILGGTGLGPSSQKIVRRLQPVLVRYWYGNIAAKYHRIPTQCSDLGEQISTPTSHLSSSPPGLCPSMFKTTVYRPGGSYDWLLVGVDICSPKSLICVGILFFGTSTGNIAA